MTNVVWGRLFFPDSGLDVPNPSNIFQLEEAKVVTADQRTMSVSYNVLCGQQKKMKKKSNGL